MGCADRGGAGSGAEGASLRGMAVLNVNDCIAEAIRLLSRASLAANDEERHQFLRRAVMWLEEAKLRAVEQWVPASEGPKDLN